MYQWQISQYLFDCYAKQVRNHSSREEVQLLLDFMNRSVVSVIKSMFLLKTTLERRTEDQNHILRLTCEKLHFYANLSHNISFGGVGWTILTFLMNSFWTCQTVKEMCVKNCDDIKLQTNSSNIKLLRHNLCILIQTFLTRNDRNHQQKNLLAMLYRRIKFY